MNWFTSQIGRLVFGRKIMQDFFSKLQLFSCYAQNIGGGADYRNSGEAKLLKFISKNYKVNSEMIVVDCGANVGNYVKAIKQQITKKTKIFALEPVKDTFEKLRFNTRELKNIVYCNYGLGKKSEILDIYKSKVDNRHASLFKRDMSHWKEDMNLEVIEKVKVVTLHDFFEEQNIDNIHFLKIDAEGNEYAILSGSKELIENQKVNIIQFEFGVCNVDSKVFFKDFYFLFKNKYSLFRILNHGLYKIKKYDERHENFLTTNYLAVSNKWISDYNLESKFK